MLESPEGGAMEALSCSVPSPSRSSLFSFAGGHSFRQVRGL